MQANRFIGSSCKTGKCINIKKAQFLAPWDMKNCVEKVRQSGNNNVMLCERGTSFGYNTLVVDMTGLRVMKEFEVPVIFDATHSVQKPGGNGSSTGGNRQYVEYLAKAAIAVGVDGLFMETHPDPDNAKSDGPNMVPLGDMKELLIKLKKYMKLFIKNNFYNLVSSDNLDRFSRLSEKILQPVQVFLSLDIYSKFERREYF